MKQKLIILSAPSGAGKTTIAKQLLDAGLGLEFSISACTREMRPGEKHGKDYYFVSAYEFKLRVEDDEFVEWEEVYPGHKYGTLQMEIDRIHEKGNTVLFDVDVKGGLTLKKIFGDQALAIFIMPPSIESLRERLENRATDTPEKISLRTAKAEVEMAFAAEFDAVVINDDLKKAVNETLRLVKNFLTLNG